MSIYRSPFSRALMLAALILAMPDAAQARGAAQVLRPAHERFIAMEGGRNFRDLGGYRTRDGRTVRWGMVYRSGSMGGLAPDAQRRLEALRPAAIVDLRGDEERARDTNHRLASLPGYWTRSYSVSQGNLGNLFTATSTERQNRASMHQVYRLLPRQQAASYRVLFARLASANGPVIFNCTAGKDRTGVAAALVLTALGVPYATVRKDYLLSNGAPGMESLAGAIPGLTITPAMKPLLAVEPGYLDAAFAQIIRDYGSVDAYLTRELGVSPMDRRRLQARLLR